MAKVSSPQASLEAIREDVRKNETQHLKVLADGMKVSFASPQASLEAIREDVRKNETQHLKVLADGMKVSFASLDEFQG